MVKENSAKFQIVGKNEWWYYNAKKSQNYTKNMERFK
jgi:serine kinase of HPr protein (carbohydrate metabolism regulator)